MIERDLNDSFPESDFATWTCPTCGARHEGVARLLGVAECPACQEALNDGMVSDWLDLLEPMERKAG